MHYYIDGYNLMFRVLRAGDDLQMQRQSIIDELNAKIIGLKATLVFDAQHQGGESSRSHVKNLQIYFTGHGETADEYILQQLKHAENPRQQTVVTSDKKLAWLARRRGAHTETVEDFLKWLNNRYKNKIARSRKRVKPPDVLPPKKKETVLSNKPSAEDYFDYYLEQFEAGFKEIPQKKKVPKTKQDKALSDMERWLKAFEQNDST